MKIEQGAEFQRQWRELRFRFTCEDCGNFDRGSCAHGFPTAPHRAARYLDRGGEPLLFCKDFELD